MKNNTCSSKSWLAGICLAIAADLAQASEPLVEVQAKFDAMYGAGEVVVTATPFDGIYSYYPKGSIEEKGGRQSTADLKLMANDGGRGWVTRADRLAVAPEVLEKLRGDAAAQLPLEKAIMVIKKGAPLSMMIYSALDCGACITLEKYLSKAGFSYGIYPTSLNNKRLDVAEEVYCHATPSRAWAQLMIKRELIPSPRAKACTYPRDEITAVGAMFAGGRTPTIIFADGDVSLELQDDIEGQKKMTAYIREKIRKGVVFKPKG